MNTEINFGTPEVLLLCGTALLIQDIFAIGLTLLILGFTASMARASLKIAAAQEEAKAKQELMSKVNNVGEDFGAAVGSFLTALANSKNQDGTVH
jgi:predicted MFS family arabinose efflux permease